MQAEPDLSGDDLDAPPPGPPMVWLISLADLAMLMMSFFIYLFAVSTADPEGVKETLESVRERLRHDSSQLKPGQDATVRERQSVLDQIALREQLAQRQRQTYEDLNAFFKGRGESTAQTKLDGPRMTISLPSQGMFSAADQAELTPQGRQRLLIIKDFLARHPDQRVLVKGYTDDQPPPPGSRLRDNWEVSSLQAAAALRFLMSQGVPANRLTSTGLADLEPLLPNTSDDNRGRNRRLEFVLEVQVEG